MEKILFGFCSSHAQDGKTFFNTGNQSNDSHLPPKTSNKILQDIIRAIGMSRSQGLLGNTENKQLVSSVDLFPLMDMGQDFKK